MTNFPINLIQKYKKVFFEVKFCLKFFGNSILNQNQFNNWKIVEQDELNEGYSFREIILWEDPQAPNYGCKNTM